MRLTAYTRVSAYIRLPAYIHIEIRPPCIIYPNRVVMCAGARNGGVHRRRRRTVQGA